MYNLYISGFICIIFIYTRFPFWGDGGVPALAKNLLNPLPGKFLPVDFPLPPNSKILTPH